MLGGETLCIYSYFMATENTTWNNVPMEGKSINLTLSLPYKDLKHILGTTTQ